uniref:RRM domain-containing protein n=1 Tax=Onchocerca volvulus TaxID=6282 RepID=A0A8R1TU36_ONCVO
MESITGYYPGAVSNLLVKKGSNTATDGKDRKRKKENESRKNESVTLFKKRINKSQCFQLPTGEKKLQPKSVGLNGTDDLTSGSSLRESSSCEMKMKKEVTMEENIRTVFVGNAPLSSTRKGIKKLFSQFGVVESVRLHYIASNEKITKKRNIPSDVRSLTFYVKFKDAKSTEAALALNGEKYDGNLLRVDSCCTKRKYSSRTTVFVGNLPYDVSENELIAHFETSGNVSFVRIVRDSKTGSGKGFAFVAFKESEAVQFALQLDGSIFKRRRLRVKRVQKKNKVGYTAAQIRSETYQHSVRAVSTQRTRHMPFDRSIKSISKKKVRKGGKRKVKNSIMT